MTCRPAFGFIFLCLTGPSAVAQVIDNLASFRIIDADKYIRFHYENDYFTATDYYYTQGMNFEMVDPSFNKIPLTGLLVKAGQSPTRYGISIEHNGYTPTSIEHDEILYGDRPFAAALMMKSFCSSQDSKRHLRITSSLSLGVIGPAAGGYGMQKTIHRWVHDTKPKGWENQIQNDLVLNYEGGAEKNVFSLKKGFVINALANGRAGTLDTKISSGLVFMLGRLNPAIQSIFNPGNSGSIKKLTFHFYFQPLVNLVVYDATLQGGLFNHTSPYTLTSGDVEHVTLQANYGAVLNFKSLYFEYFKTSLTKEFETGMPHRWGGVRMGMKL